MPKISFDITQGFPNVLLLGNGPFRCTGIPMSDLLKATARAGRNPDDYLNDTGKAHLIPNSILTVATGIIDDSGRRNQYRKITNEITCADSCIADRISALPLDAIVTTNYTYEIENSLRPSYSKLSPSSVLKYVVSTEQDKKYLLHTANVVSPAAVPVWHAHGELRRPSSMILSLDEYARLMGKLLEHNERHGNYKKAPEDVEFRTWSDYLILGNVFCLGFSFDYSEFDMWWILSRRLREENYGGTVGKFVFLSPDKENMDSSEGAKLKALKDSGVFRENLGISIPANASRDLKNDCYQNFYIKAIDYISSAIAKTKEDK